MEAFFPERMVRMIPKQLGNTEAKEGIAASYSNKMHYFASRETTLQTPVPSRFSHEHEEDATVTWVRSLPSPFNPFDGFEEAYTLPQEFMIESAESASLGSHRFTPQEKPAETELPDGTLMETTAQATKINHSPKPGNEDTTPYSFKDRKACASTTMNDIPNTQTKKGNAVEELTLSKAIGKTGDGKRSLETRSPSGPSRKMQALQHDNNREVIEVREDFSPNDRASSVGSFCSTSSDILLSPSAPMPNPRMQRDIVRRYLKQRDEMKIIMLHAKVVQKSYGSEKRFFCPPPCIRLVGDGWKRKKRRKNAFSSATSSPMPSPLNPTTSGNITKASEVCAFIGVAGGDNEMQQLCLDTMKSYAAARNLHTPDSDKRKHFQLHVKMFYGDGTEIGRFLSKRIKVISKPSKKMQSVKNPELCIASGTKVSLFNRIRSQTVSTRYLFATTEGYCASSTQWGAFYIYLARDDEKDERRFEAFDGYVRYGNSVKLVCSLTGIALPRLVIRKVDKHDAIIDTDEPISQFHRCALFLHNTKRQYLCLSQDKVIAHTATACVGSVDRLNDGSCWTIISAEKAEYCWSDSSLHLSNNIGVTPVPTVHSLQINGGGEMAMIELIGENFAPNLTLWFGTVEANTMYRCEECLVCVVPEIRKIKPDWRYVKEPIKVPLVLTRDDGLLYPTHIDFFYIPETGRRTTPHPTIREILRTNQFDINM